MKRSYTNAQLAYPDSYAAAKRRRVASRLSKQYTPFTQPQVKYIQKLANQGAKRVVMRDSDKKAVQDVSGILSVSSSGAIIDVLHNLSRGDDSVNQFSGSKIMPYNWTVNYLMDFTPTESETGSNYTSIRFMLIQEIGAGVASGVGDYMNLGLSTTYPQLALVNWENNENWRCLYDSGPVTVTTTANFASSLGMTKTGKITIPKSALRTVYYGQGETSPEKNNLRILVWTDSSVTPHPIFYTQSEVDFTDGA